MVFDVHSTWGRVHYRDSLVTLFRHISTADICRYFIGGNVTVIFSTPFQCRAARDEVTSMHGHGEAVTSLDTTGWIERINVGDRVLRLGDEERDRVRDPSTRRGSQP